MSWIITALLVIIALPSIIALALLLSAYFWLNGVVKSVEELSAQPNQKSNESS